MDIGFTEEQELLRASASGFLENECPSAFVRQRMVEPAAISDVFWQKLEPNVRWDAAGITPAARETAGGFVLSGTKLFVPDAHLSDALVVAMRAQNGSMMENGLSLFLVTKDTADPTVTSPGSTTCTSTSSAPRPPRSPSTT
jgi:hypothetical protein